VEFKMELHAQLCINIFYLHFVIFTILLYGLTEILFLVAGGFGESIC
jgi:hypothetical protein